jgi:hypothetical protein
VARRPRDPIAAAARDLFGWRQLRPGQKEVVSAVLDGRDALAMMATGYGKSAIYAGKGAKAPGEEPFAVGSRVAHAEWGEGDVQRYEASGTAGEAGGRIVVLFDDVGYKTLSLEVVRDRGLLAPAAG